MWTAPGYEHVAEAFERNFTERGELGAAFAAYHRGELVVDLWAVRRIRIPGGRGTATRST